MSIATRDLSICGPIHRKRSRVTRNFAEAVHPMGGVWTCGTCEVRIQAGHLCPDCGTVLCDGCVERRHDIPAGARTGKPCRNSPALEAEPAPENEPVAAA